MNNVKENAAANLAADRAAADQWLEDNAHLMAEDVSTEKRLEFGAEYFDIEGSDVDLDGMDYYTRLGQAGVSEASHTVYAEATDKPADSYHPQFVAGTCHANSKGDYVQGSISSSHITEGLIVHPSCKVTKVAYKGTPRTVRKPAAARNVNHVQNVIESNRLNQLANKHQQKARRLAKKEQITLTAAMDRLGF